MVRAAIVGCGRIAGGYDRRPQQGWAFTHAGAYRLVPGVQLVAAADADVNAGKAFASKWQIPAVYEDASAMFEAERPDIVSICTPPESHVRLLGLAAKGGVRGVWLEKPVAPTVREAIAATSVAGDTIVAVNYFRRWNPTLVRLRQDMQQGRWGQVRRVTVHTAKGVMGNASHFIDLLRWMIGEPSTARAFASYTRSDGDEGRDFELRFPGGAIATFLHMNAPYILHEVDFFCDTARITIGQRGQQLQVSPAHEEPHYGGFSVVTPGDWCETAWRDAAALALADLVSGVETGQQPACTLADGIRALEIAATVVSAPVPSMLECSL